MAETLFPAFEAALNTNDHETLRKLYALEHSWRTRAEAQVQALLWKEAHGPSGKAATPGYLAAGVSIATSSDTSPPKAIQQKFSQQKFSRKPAHALSSAEIPI